MTDQSIPDRGHQMFSVLVHVFGEVVDGKVSGGGPPGRESQFTHLEAVWPGETDLTSLCFSFLICRKGRTMDYAIDRGRDSVKLATQCCPRPALHACGSDLEPGIVRAWGM